MNYFNAFKKETQLAEKIWWKTRNRPRKCFDSNCEELAIRSHYHQVHGVLNDLSSDDLVWGLGVVPKGKGGYDKNYEYEFIRKSINHKGELTTFCGFCNKHDSKIFDKIENVKYKPYNYKSREVQLLHAYRGVCNELHKQEYNVQAVTSILANQNIKLIKQTYLKEDLKGKMKVRMTRYVKKQIEEDLYNNTEHFIFEHFELPRIDICTTAIPGAMPEFDNLNASNWSYWKNIVDNFKYIEGSGATNFIILIPQNNSLNVIIGTNKKKLFENFDLKKIASYTKEKKIAFISDLIVREIETWVISNKLYQEWKEIGWDKKVIDEINRHKPPTTILKATELNIFKHYI